MIYHVFANRSNAGDWLAALGIRKLLGPLPVIECLCDEPFVPQTLVRLEQAAPWDLIIIGGGGLFMDYFQPFWEGFLPIAQRVRYCLWGVGCCQMKWQNTRLPVGLVRDIVNGSQFCVVRDELTRDSLPGCKVEDAVPCPSLVMFNTQTVSGAGVLHVASYEESKPEVYNAMRRCARRYAKDSGRRYCEVNNRIPNGSLPALEELIQQYVQADVVLSARLHGCVIALALGRKVLAVSNDLKIESFMRMVGLEQWVVDYSAVADLPVRIKELPGQEAAHGFVARAVTQHQEIAAWVIRSCTEP